MLDNILISMFDKFAYMHALTFVLKKYFYCNGFYLIHNK